MRVREYLESDEGLLRQYHEENKYAFDFPSLNSPLIELVEVVEDINGNPMMAGVAKKSLELFLLCNHKEHPMVRMQGIGMLHASMTPKLLEKGYDEANAFIPPELARYARRLCTQFGWIKNWDTYTIRG